MVEVDRMRLLDQLATFTLFALLIGGAVAWFAAAILTTRPAPPTERQYRSINDCTNRRAGRR
jgi:hypothetical protein